MKRKNLEGKYMHFFLQGEPQVGKSHLLQTTLEDYSLKITGYTPQRLYQGGEVVAYRSEMMKDNQPTIELDGCYQSSYSHILIDRVLKKRDITVPETMIKNVRRTLVNQDYNLVMLDEIGGFEMDSNLFIENVLSILNSQSCIGVIKHPLYAMNMIETSKAAKNYQILVDKIQENGTIYTMNTTNYSLIKEKFSNYLNEISKTKRNGKNKLYD